MGNIMAKVFSVGAKELVGTVDKLIDNLSTSKEEKEAAKLAAQQEINRHIESMESQAVELEKTYMADLANARGENARIQESEHASWLAKNVAYIIDLTLLVAFIFFLVIIFEKQVPQDNKEIFYMAFGSLITYLGTSITFHRGTSKGSEDKQKTLNRMVK